LKLACVCDSAQVSGGNHFRKFGPAVLAAVALLGVGSTPVSGQSAVSTAAKPESVATVPPSRPATTLPPADLPTTTAVGPGARSIAAPAAARGSNDPSDAAYIGKVLADGPIGYWPLNDPAGNAIHDEVGSNTGTANGGVSVAAGNPFSATAFSRSLDGSVAIVAPSTVCTGVSLNPALVKPSGAMSVEAWVKTRDSNGVLFRHRYFGYLLAFFDGLPVFETTQGNLTEDRLIVRGTRRVDDGKWHHVVGTKQISSGLAVNRLYVDGVLVGTTTLAKPVTATFYDDFPDPAAIGRDGSACDSRLNTASGLISHVAVYGTELPAARVAVHATRVLGESFIQTKILSALGNRCLLTDLTIPNANSCPDSKSTWSLQILDDEFTMAAPDGRCLSIIGTQVTMSASLGCTRFITLIRENGKREIRWSFHDINAPGVRDREEQDLNGNVVPITPCLSVLTGVAAVENSCKSLAFDLVTGWSFGVDPDPLYYLGDNISSNPEVGKLFVTRDGSVIGFCSGAVIDRIGTVSSAGHCFSNGANGAIFIPSYNNGALVPHGVYVMTKGRRQKNKDADYAFITVIPISPTAPAVVKALGVLKTRVLQSLPVGVLANREAQFDTSKSDLAGGASAAGYPGNIYAGEEPLLCSGPVDVANAFALSCAMFSGSSGSPWIVDGYSAGSLVTSVRDYGFPYIFRDAAKDSYTALIGR
jgi:Concanavalin A-like lectin/glucanases superfamily